jgi:hypothetical protein
MAMAAHLVACQGQDYCGQESVASISVNQNIVGKNLLLRYDLKKVNLWASMYYSSPTFVL